MSEIHTFVRPETPSNLAKVGEPYAPGFNKFEEGARYLYANGAHELTLFWSSPSPAEVLGLRNQPVEVALYGNGPAAFLLYRIKDVCEWSDVAFNVNLLPEDGRELPAEPAGERARLIITLVDAADGLVKGRRLVSLDRVMTQALRHVMTEQAKGVFVRPLYDIAVQEVHARFPDTDAMVEAAEVVEATLG
jgi:hypothetical protein